MGVWRAIYEAGQKYPPRYASHLIACGSICLVLPPPIASIALVDVGIKSQ